MVLAAKEFYSIVPLVRQRHFSSYDRGNAPDISYRKVILSVDGVELFNGLVQSFIALVVHINTAITPTAKKTEINSTSVSQGSKANNQLK